MDPVSPATLPYSAKPWWSRPVEKDRPALHWHVASRAFALLTWTVPQKFRFRLARNFTAGLTPLIKRTSWYRSHAALGIDGVEETTLYYALNIMSHSGARFDLDLKIEGAEVLEAALKESRGTLIVSPHSLLSLMLFRYLHDLGCVPQIVSVAPFVHIYGTRVMAPTMKPSASTFIRLRSSLREGEIVCAMIDKQPPESPRAIRFQTLNGEVYVSDALIRLAERCDAGIIFTSARVDEHYQIVLRFETPKLAGDDNADVTASFVEFLQEHIERRKRRH